MKGIFEGIEKDIKKRLFDYVKVQSYTYTSREKLKTSSIINLGIWNTSETILSFMGPIRLKEIPLVGPHTGRC